MKLAPLLMAVILLIGTACSSKKKQAAEDGQTTDQIAAFGEDADFIIESDSDDLLAVESSGSGESIDPMIQEQLDAPVLESDFAVTNVATTGQIGEYTIQSGDTYMLIAFKLYGDYRKWKTVADMNPGLASTQLSAGKVIKYDVPAQPFVWNPQGNPHVIKMGETLGTISNDKYGTASRWRSIYDNNRPMIHDPNLIFAGFTLYWVADRDLASE